ncbi:MAG: cytochrome P450 [Holophagaceae bacterium]|nr:cytochrome P450 [Holophagaceae bacterium]
MTDAPGLTAPGPRAWPVLGHAWRLKQDILGAFQSARRDHGDVARLLLGPLPMHLVSSPALAREVLQTRAAAFDRRTRSVALLMDITGESLLTANGAAWIRRRRLAGPAFHPDRIDALVPLFVQAAKAQADAWSAQVKAGEDAVDFGPAMAGLAFRIAAEAFFSSDVEGDVDAMERAMGDVLAHYWKRMSSLSDWPQRLPNASRTRYRDGLARIRGMVDRIVAARAGKRGMDLLERLLAEGGPDGLTSSEQRNEVLTLLMAGHETTANALAWCFELLARHPEAADGVRVEAQRVLGGRLPTAADLPSLPFTRAVFQEALRLYPTIWVLERRAIEAETLGGFHIPKGTSVLVSPFVLHRHPEHWDDPERFDPARFLGDEEHAAYLPFGMGPHTCLGMHFALAEAVAVLAVLLPRFRFAPVEPVPPRPIAGLTLRLPAGTRLRLEALEGP